MLVKILSYLVDDIRSAHRWWSVRFLSGGALLSAFAFALSLSSAGMQFLDIMGVRGVVLICGAIFIAALLGRIIKQRAP